MKNKAYFFTFLISYFLIFLLAGCQWKENYVTQYGFTAEKISASVLEPTSDGFKLQIPLSDFSCLPASFKLYLDKNNNDLTMTLKGTETTEHCYYKFYANVSGAKPGAYQLKVIYQKAEENQEIFSQQFTIQ